MKSTPVHGSTTSSVRLPSTSSPPISIRTMSLSLFSGGQGHPIIVIVRLGRRRIVEPFNHARLKPAHKVDRSLFYMAITANLRWQEIEERRGGKGWFRRGGSRWSPYL